MNNNEDFLKAIKSAKGKKSTQLIGFFERESEPVADMIIDNITLKGKSIEFISFTNCRFNGCQFDRVSFENCQFIDCSFVSCLIDYSEFDVTALWNCSFLESSINEGTFRNAVITKVSFKKCRITQSRFIYSGFSDTFIHECALISVSIDGILAFGSTIFELPEAPLNFRQTQHF
jgi:uncharacterized protein YjbI with pentapeptide repeats